jgi:hypothetical protein
MKKALRLLAALLALAVVVLWLATGADRGWTKTSVPVSTPDAVTGLDNIEWRRAFVPGLDFLAAGVAVAAALVGVSFFFRNKSAGK